ncbi:FAD-binding oxidoreductase [Neisseriaceae bacterium TC5R-5]|nr:FAD-binding oxidoreductase [Neisseriaceae bacterium TC5R-5]
MSLRTYHYRLALNQQLGQQVRRVRLECIGPKALRFQEGQYVGVSLNGVQRSYSMAAPQAADGSIELHIRLQPGGQFSHCLQQAQIGDLLSLSGPYGSCIWQESSSSISQVIMLATGTGIAPLKAILEKQLTIAADTLPEISLYWGGVERKDLYLLDYFQGLAQQYPSLHFVPVLSGATDQQGRRGFVQQCAAQDFPAMQHSIVYACGAPAMVDGARQLLLSRCQLAEQNFFADAFNPTAVPSVEHGIETANLLLEIERQDGGKQQLSVPAVGSLMQALSQAQLLSGVCGGEASCGTCRVSVHPDWLERLPAQQRTEKRLLAVLDGQQPQHRLACQIPLQGALDGLKISLSTKNP